MTKNNTQSNIRRKFRGVVVSSGMDKTLVVQVDRTVVHPKYGKRYIRSRKFHVHDEQNAFKVGDKIVFVECRPLSKSKRWRALKAS